MFHLKFKTNSEFRQVLFYTLLLIKKNNKNLS